MTGPRRAIARVGLARSLPRLLALPGLLVVLGLVGIAVGALFVPGLGGLGLLGAGAALGLAGLALAAVLLTVRLDVEESAVRVSWLGGGRVYELASGPVTRVRLRGPNASRLRIRWGALGWGLGRAILRGEEAIQVVRLAATPTAILVPTDRGRLAIAPARDDALLDALSRAARARQQREAPAADAAEPLDTPAQAAAPAVDQGEPEIEAREVPEPPHVLTGIERAQLEERLAEERAAEERLADERAAAAMAATTVAAEQEAPIAETLPTEAVVAPARARRRPRMQVRRPGARAAFVFLPLLGAGLAWMAGLATGRMPDPGTDLARLTWLALVMAGPATSVGAVMALAWWPRLVGVVVTGGLVASVFIGRALIAP